MAKIGDFSNFMHRLFYEDDEPKAEIEVTETPQPEQTELSEEEVAEFEESVSTESTENIPEKAKKIIIDSQIASDNDEYPDISNVETVLMSVGDSCNTEMIQKILINVSGLNLEGLKTDGSIRKQAILDAIAQMREKTTALRDAKAQEEQALVQAEKDIESACTAAISEANSASEKAIEEEKARSATVIAEIRNRTEQETAAAHEQRDLALKDIAKQRSENESAVRNATDLMSETEKQGNVIINQIDKWLSCLN